MEADRGDVDLGGYLLNLGGKLNLGKLDLHGEIIYASGDDDPDDGDQDAFQIVPGRSHYWAEILGWGIFDFQASANAPADAITNLMAANLGTTIKPMDKLSLTFDAWYVELAEDNAAGDSELGTELDLVVTYELVKGLKLDLVGAYLFAGNATYNGPDEADPYEIGSRLSLSF